MVQGEKMLLMRLPLVRLVIDIALLRLGSAILSLKFLGQGFAFRFFLTHTHAVMA